MAIIDSIKEKSGEILYPRTVTKAIYDADTDIRLDHKISNIEQDVTNLRNTKADEATIQAAVAAVAAVSADLTQHKLDYASQRSQDNLKVTKVEKDISDYRRVMSSVNVNQEAKQKASGYGTVSLPKNAANGQVSASVKGRTLKNELNYNRETWAEWVKFAGAVGDNTGLEFTLSDVSAVVAYLPNTTFKPNTKYGLLFELASNSLITKHIQLRDELTGVYTSIVLPNTPLGSQKFSFTTQSIISNNRFYIVRSSNGDLNSRVKMKGFRVFELPTGSEIENDFNTMTADQLAIKYPYIKGDSTKSTISDFRLKSVGKNLLIKNDFILSTRIAVDDMTNIKKIIINKRYGAVFCNLGYASSVQLIEQGIYRCSGGAGTGADIIIKGLPNTTYKINYNLEVLSGSIEPYHIKGWNTKTLTTDSDGFVRINTSLGIKFVTAGTVEVKDLMISIVGSTSYEPYTESTQYINGDAELRSLPNGTKDEIRAKADGSYERVQNVSDDTILIPSNISVYGTETAEWDYVRFNLALDNFKTLVNNVSGLNGQMRINGWSEIPFNDRFSANPSGNRFYVAAPNVLILIVPKGTCTSLSDARAKFPQLTLTYQLLIPEEIPIEVSGTLLSYPDGTVYVENVVADAGLYTTKLSVLNTDLPIQSMEKVSKVDFTTGVETELNASQCVVATDKLSFTHPSLAANDIVFFTYYHDVEGTLGETEITYYDSRHTLKDSVTGKFYKVVPTVANGVLTNGLVEV